MEKLKKRKTGTLFLVGAIIFALAAAFLTAVMIRSYTETKDVVTVVSDVKAFERLEKSVLTLMTIPVAAVPADAITRIEDVQDKFIKTGVLKETILRQGHISDEFGGSSLSAKLTYTEEADMRAFALPYENIITFGGRIEEEDRIDIVASLNIEEGKVRESSAKVIAQNVRVLDVVTGELKAIIIAVTPNQAEELVFLLENGKVYASLNPYEADTSAASTEGVYNVDKFMNLHLRQGVINEIEPDVEINREED